MTKNTDGEGHPHEGHPHAKLAAEIAGAAGAAAIIGVEYIQWRKQRRKDSTYEASNYKNQLRIFEDDNLEPAVRDLLAPLAVRIHYATTNTAAKVILRSKLVEQNGFAEADPHSIAVALGCLEDPSHDLIGYRPSLMDESQDGLYSKSALDWGINHGEVDSLAQAYAELIQEMLTS